jgi:hypothetical protein
MISSCQLAAVLGAFAQGNTKAVAAGVARARLGGTALEVGSLKLSGGTHGGGEAGRDADGRNKSNENGGELHFAGFYVFGWVLVKRSNTLLDEMELSDDEAL